MHVCGFLARERQPHLINEATQRPGVRFRAQHRPFLLAEHRAVAHVPRQRVGLPVLELWSGK